MPASRSLKPKRSTLASDKGFTLIELLVTSVLGLIMLALTLSATTSNRRLYKYDLVRTRINQNMRSALDIMGIDVRQAGENLFSTFPAIEIVNGASGTPDDLVIRRNLLDEVYNVCLPIAAGSGNSTVIVADNSVAQPGCDKTSNLTTYNSWRAKRLADPSAVINAYIYNRSTKLGEFFHYQTEATTSTQYSLTRSGGSWQNAYPVGASSIYVLEEWRYRIRNNVLQIVLDQDTTNALNVVDGVTDFQVSALMQDGSTRLTFIPGDNWSQLKSISVSVTGRDTALGKTLNRTLAANFFPRNILSN
jgi:type IV pilus assembly protein PilW